MKLSTASCIFIKVALLSISQEYVVGIWPKSPAVLSLNKDKSYLIFHALSVLSFGPMLTLLYQLEQKLVSVFFIYIFHDTGVNKMFLCFSFF